MYGVSEIETRTSSSFGIVIAYYNTRGEIRLNHNGFYGRVTIDKEKALFSLDRGRPIDEVNSLPTSKNQLFT